jgi:hypothetical protein
MLYDFKFVLRSDDYHPVFLRIGNNATTIKEILYLDDSATFLLINGDITSEGTGNLCLFTARITSDNPTSWLNAARTYASLRHLDAEVSITEYKEPEIIEQAEE